MSAITVRLTTPLRGFVGGKAEVQVTASTVAEALSDLQQRYPALVGRLTEADGRLREFIQIHVGKKPLRALGGAQAALQPGDVISVTSPFSGG
jgi:molybdopterin converting factor small subunit